MSCFGDASPKRSFDALASFERVDTEFSVRGNWCRKCFDEGFSFCFVNISIISPSIESYMVE